jgi:glycosyltransferase involved in cell wall biosynthesis
VTEKPVVSVVIPSFNREKWLPVSISSVIGQTFSDWELLLVDDGSTDNTEALVQTYANQDPRIRYVRNTRTKGPAGARNQGMDVAQGKYVALLDSDDEWEADHLQIMVFYLEKYGDQIDIITADAVRKNRLTGEVYSADRLDLEKYCYSSLEDAVVFDRETLFETAFVRPILRTQTMVMKREVLSHVRFDEELPPGPEDDLFHLEIAYQKFNVAYLPRFHVTYWAHGENLTCCAGISQIADRIPLFLGFEQTVLKVLREFDVTAAQRRQLRHWLADLYVWKLGYHGFILQGEFSRGRAYYRKGIRLVPFRCSYWKSYLASFARQLATQLRKSGAESLPLSPDA